MGMINGFFPAQPPAPTTALPTHALLEQNPPLLTGEEPNLDATPDLPDHETENF